MFLYHRLNFSSIFFFFRKTISIYYIHKHIGKVIGVSRYRYTVVYRNIDTQLSIAILIHRCMSRYQYMGDHRDIITWIAILITQQRLKPASPVDNFWYLFCRTGMTLTSTNPAVQCNFSTLLCISNYSLLEWPVRIQVW